ncbi:hypothetical protein B5C34_08840 [Pacificimonas flava]|uniref:Tetratricopeptide repeat protein n=2 Tax=Pacificimonas TaxID=1960290 RepID=A0A219B701_9SPHN|nr:MULTISPECIES: hypothetical protein [Pacificimonas]MBZ6379228.1 hypothetical protein [Pacificimonas aurantium]OWV33558.1 hypothetical protein B5C34_08840 [Pacificimonas flava]
MKAAMLASLLLAAASVSAGPATDGLPEARRPGFAARLAERPLPHFALPGAPALNDTLLAIAAGSADDRQLLRWDHALNLLAHNRAADASGVLQVMLDDDPDLALVANYQFALGAAYASMYRGEAALMALSDPVLAAEPRACLWRMRAFMLLGMPADAEGEWACGRAGLKELEDERRRDFRYDYAAALLAVGKAEEAVTALASFPEDDAGANLLRGKALVDLGQPQEARHLFARVDLSGSPEERADAQFSTIALTKAVNGSLTEEQERQLDRLSLSWRGGDLERRLLRFELQEAGDDDERALAAGAALLRYHPPGPHARELGEELASRLERRLEDERVPLDRLGGLFWEYRDLLPGGLDGDRLVGTLADRFREAGLYERAAELLDYRLRVRARDLAKGPLSIEVARLFLLAGQPQRAVDALQASDDVRFTDQMRWDRQKLEAVAVYNLSRPKEALAILQDVPGSDDLAAAMHWESGNWTAFTAANRHSLAGAGNAEVRKVAVLKHAVALAMTGDRAALAALDRDHGRVLDGDPLEALFDVLVTGSPPSRSDVFAEALAALPRSANEHEFAKLIRSRRDEAAREG